MKTIYLVCEGNEGSLDRLVLRKLLNDYYGYSLYIESAGGDSSLYSVAQYLKQKHKDCDAFSIEDRNYKSREEAERSWEPTNKKFIWSRHEIENYLIEPVVIATTFKRLSEDADVSIKLPQELHEIRTWLRSLAQPMCENHVGWSCYYKLLPYELGYNFRITRPQGFAGDTTKATWVEYLIKECRNKQGQSTRYGTDARLSTQEIEKTYEMEFSNISRSDYWEQDEYIIDFGGKEIINEMMREFGRYGLQNFKRDDFYEKLIQSLIENYKQEIFRPDDFVKLAELVRANEK